MNAKCNNTLGSHTCECQPGYTGNGQNCKGEFNVFVTIFNYFSPKNTGGTFELSTIE